MRSATTLPPLPRVGYPETWYSHQIHSADRHRDVHRHESLKVAQYVTLALNPDLAWPQKLRFFEHALHRHCTPPPAADPAVLAFYTELRQLVKESAGTEAVKLASAADDALVARLARGESRESVKSSAIQFFGQILGDTHRTPDYFNFNEWHELMVLRSAWT